MKVSVVILLMSVAVAARAHDLWLERELGGLSLYYGHSHSQHDGARHLQYPAEWVREAMCVDEKGERLDVPAEKVSPFRLEGDCAAAYVLT